MNVNSQSELDIGGRETCSVLTTDEKYFAILEEKDLFSSVCEKCHTFLEGFSYFILLILITTELKV